MGLGPKDGGSQQGQGGKWGPILTKEKELGMAPGVRNGNIDSYGEERGRAGALDGDKGLFA